jgi:hypothetical protein
MTQLAHEEDEMPVVTKYRQGVPNWVDVSTPDIDASVAFYEGLFGWTGVDQGADAGRYHLFELDGHNVAGLGPVQVEGQPAAWTTYLAVDDIDAALTGVADAGGTVLMPAVEIFTSGSMAVVLDPSGAAVALWQAGDHIGCQRVNEPNCAVWNELTTRDADAAQSFYTSVFGSSFASMDDAGDSAYRLMSVGERVVAGVQPMIGDIWGDLPSHWMTYFAVDDVDAAVARAVELGGAVRVPGEDNPMGRFSVVADPVGAVFTVMSFNDPMDPVADGIA